MTTMGKVIKCLAAVAWEAGKSLSVEEVEVDPPKAGEVRIKIFHAGICDIDSYALSGKEPESVFPIILGHEGSGVIESVGAGVTSVAPGDTVIPLYVPQCKTCKLCLHPKANLCQKIRVTQEQGVMPDGTRRFRCKGKEIYHFMGCSTFSQYTVVAEISACKVAHAVPPSQACLLSCVVPRGYGSVFNIAKVEPGSNCAIFGLGALGLVVALGCKAARAKRIIGVDLDPARYEIAKRYGVTEFINPKHFSKPIQDVLVVMTDGGLDYTFECTGNVDTMMAALEACHKGWGESVIVGVAAAGEEIRTRPFQLVTGRVWKGAAFGGYKSHDGVPKLAGEYLKTTNSKLPLNWFVTHLVFLEDINEAFHLMHDSNSIYTFVTM